MKTVISSETRPISLPVATLVGQRAGAGASWASHWSSFTSACAAGSDVLVLGTAALLLPRLLSRQLRLQQAPACSSSSRRRACVTLNFARCAGGDAAASRRGASAAVVAAAAADDASIGGLERRLTCPPALLAICEGSLSSSNSSSSSSSSPDLAAGSSDPSTAKREWFVGAVRCGETLVPMQLWVFYQDWTFREISGRIGRSGSWHNFAVARALGLSKTQVADTTGGEVGDLLSCMAIVGLLGPGSPQEAMTVWLEDAKLAYDKPFIAAADRTYSGFTYAEEGEWRGSYDFLQIADPQLGMLDWDKSWTEELTMLRLAIQHANRLRPRFFFVSGDLINMFPSGEGAIPDVARREVASFKEALRELDPSIPIVLQPGNHDIGQTPFPEDLTLYQERFGDDYFSFWVGGVLYISLNSQYYMDSEHTVAMREEQDLWLEEVLAEAGKAKQIIIMSHVPPFVSSLDEAQGWSNWEVEPRNRIFDAVQKAGASLWMCGHYHANLELVVRGVEIVVTGACGGVINWTRSAGEVATQPRPNFATSVGSPPVVADALNSGIRLVRVKEDEIDHRWFTMSTVPATLDEAFATPRPKTTKKLSKILGLDDD